MNEILEYIAGYIEFSDILSTSNLSPSQVLLDFSGPHYLQFRPQLSVITYELLSHAIERSNNIVSLFKELENIRIDA
jgi:hypothetical protein